MHTARPMSRYQAAGIHLAISALVALAFLALLFFVWYPEPYFAISGGEHLLIVLIAVDVSIGPLLTLVVFQHGKPGLARDLAVIAILQIAALVYGGSVITSARPVYVVYTIDRFVVVSANDITEEAWERAAGGRYDSPTWFGPELVSVPMPKDLQTRNELMMAVLTGKTDMPLEPRLYVPYREDINNVLERLRDPAEFGATPPPEIAEALAAHRRGTNRVGWLPLMGRTRSAVMLLDASDAQPIALVDVDPWRFINPRRSR